MTDITERLALQPEDIGGPSRMDMLRERIEAKAEIDRLRARVAELESQPADQFTGQLVEIDGHVYGLRPGAARVVKEAMQDAGRYRWLREQTNQPDCLDDFDGIIIQAGYVGAESILLGGDLDAAIDAAMAKDDT